MASKADLIDKGYFSEDSDYPLELPPVTRPFPPPSKDRLTAENLKRLQKELKQLKLKEEAKPRSPPLRPKVKANTI